MKSQQPKEMAMVCVEMMVSTLKTLETVGGEMDGKPLERRKLVSKQPQKRNPLIRHKEFDQRFVERQNKLNQKIISRDLILLELRTYFFQ